MRSEVCAADRSSDAKLSPRLFIHYRVTNLKFLIDTGSDVTVVPVTDEISIFSIDHKLFAANSSKIRTYGSVLLIKLSTWALIKNLKECSLSRILLDQSSMPIF